jgi:hypothetical protein
MMYSNTNVAESFKEIRGSKMSVLPIMMMTHQLKICVERLNFSFELTLRECSLYRVRKTVLASLKSWSAFKTFLPFSSSVTTIYIHVISLSFCLNFYVKLTQFWEEVFCMVILLEKTST